MKNEMIYRLAFLGTGAAAGLGLGYLLANKVLKRKFEAIANEEIISVKESYKRLHKEGEYANLSTLVTQTTISPVELVEQVKPSTNQLRTALGALGYLPSPELEAEDKVEVRPNVLNIFDDAAELANTLPSDDDEFERLLAERDESEPYVISIEEYSAEEFNHLEKLTITYWDGDDTLADDRETIVPDVEGTVGTCLSYFGVGSQDKNIVYVRNERVSADFEVVFDPRAYSQAVMNIDNWDAERGSREVKARLKMRRDDE